MEGCGKKLEFPSLKTLYLAFRYHSILDDRSGSGLYYHVASFFLDIASIPKVVRMAIIFRLELDHPLERDLKEIEKMRRYLRDE